MEKKIDQYIDEHFDEMLDTLRSLIQIPSYRTQAAEGKPYGEKVAQALDKALSLMLCRKGTAGRFRLMRV